MNNLFDCAAVFSDLHIGLRNNSVEHNDDCISYIYWFIEKAKKRNAETCIMMGDFHHHRNTINAHTLEYGIKIMSLLNDSFKKTYFMVGNHDMYFRQDRSITAMRFATLFPNIVFVDQPIIVGNVGLVPWLVNDEWKQVSKMKSKYIFGHLELPGFKMNAHIDMPDTGQLNSEHFIHQEKIFSGHFHKRQHKGNISYIGNPFGHTYADAWDFERGCMFLEWDGEPEYIDYLDGPKFINITLSALANNQELYLKPKTYLQVTLDMDISYEEAMQLREELIKGADVREFKLIKNPAETVDIEYSPELTIKTVDQIIIESINSLDSESFSSATLLEIYQSL